MITVDKAKELLQKELPVIFGGSEYLKINALIFRKHKNGFSASVELQDKAKHCIVVAPIQWVEESTGEKIETHDTTELKDLINESAKMYAEFYEESGKEKSKVAQEKLYALIRKLLEVDTFIREDIKVNEIEVKKC